MTSWWWENNTTTKTMIWPSPPYCRQPESAMSNSTMTNWNSSAQRSTFMTKLTWQMGASQLRTNSQLLSKCLPQLQERGTILYWHDQLLNKFSPRLTELAEPVRELVKEKVPFNWGPEHQESFTMLKKEIVRAPILTYYNSWKETVLQTDASTKGLGACLLQDKKPVYFASKALTETQRGYIAIEIKSLTVAWAVENFHHFLYVCHFILKTNQKPLEAILSKSLNQATPQLQCILIRTLPYSFTVRYIPGPKNLLTDCLSRLGDQEDTIELPKLHVYQILHHLPARSDSLQEIQQATQVDDELALLKHTIMLVWPNNIKEIPQVLHPYWTFCEELTIEDGLILKGTWIVIPNKKCETILKQIHDSHLGLTKCKLHAKHQCTGQDWMTN